MGKWKRQPPLTPEQLPNEIRQVERELEAVEQLEEEVAREEAILEQELHPVATPPMIGPIFPTPEPAPVPPTACPMKPFLYVAEVNWNDYLGTIHIIDVEEGSVVRTVTLDQPALYMTYDPVYQRIFIMGTEDTVYVLDVETDAVIASIVAGAYPLFAGVDPVRNLLYVPLNNYDVNPDLAVIDLSTQQVIATLDMTAPDEGAKFAWVEAETGTIYIFGDGTAYDAFKIWRIDPDTYQVTLIIERVSAGWYYAAADMMRGKIYILSEFAADDPALVVFDIQTGDAKFHNIPVYGSLSVDERTGNVLLLGADTNTVYVIDPLTTYAAHHIATINSSSYISPYTSNSIVYDNIIYALTLNGEIYGFDLDTGAEVFYLALDIDTNNGGTAEFVVAPRCVEWEV